MRTMGLDIGDKKIGVAISDRLGHVARALTVIKRKNKEEDLENICKLAYQHEAEAIVIGVPFKMNGSEGSQARNVLKLANEIQEKFKQSVILWDERLTSKEAEKVLLLADAQRKLRKDVIDKVAATLILQSYLNSKKSK